MGLTCWLLPYMSLGERTKTVASTLSLLELSVSSPRCVSLIGGMEQFRSNPENRERPIEFHHAHLKAQPWLPGMVLGVETCGGRDGGVGGRWRWEIGGWRFRIS